MTEHTVRVQLVEGECLGDKLAVNPNYSLRFLGCCSILTCVRIDQRRRIEGCFTVVRDTIKKGEMGKRLGHPRGIVLGGFSTQTVHGIQIALLEHQP
jgi:hypothetical protein